MNKKFAAVFEAVLIMVSLFAFGYFAGYGEVGLVSAIEKDDIVDGFRDWLDGLGGSELIVSRSWERYPISASADDLGCCFVSEDGQVCGTAAPENCVIDSPFAEGVLCAETEFCEKGCCYDERSGIYDRNVLEVNCAADWSNDANCNIDSRSNLGCCVLGSDTIFETEGQCGVDASVRALGEGGVDWRGDLGEIECLILAETQTKGACVFDGGNCRFESEAECVYDEGEFVSDTLCTSPSLNTSCEMTEQTRCMDGEDEVFFVDSCGNSANVYDSSRVDDVDYWDVVVEGDDLCGVGEGNVESEDCGNCNRFLGGMCGVAGEGNVDIGGFYCEDVGCKFGGESYENGESWCVYDGAIGDGNDVPGSRHWKAVCSQGAVQIEPCADYRNQICIQADSFDVDGVDVEFNNAACVANNWRECIALNEDEDSIAECGETLNCRIDTIEIAPDFTFDVCLPKYPAGFSLNDERSQTGGEGLCGMADTTCTVIREPKGLFSSGCKYVANEECLSDKFGQEMNDFCRGLGDCGGSVNIEGKWSDSYKIIESEDLSDGYISDLKKMNVAVPGKFAEVEDYSKYLAAAGITDFDDLETEEEFNYNSVAAGISGLSMALYASVSAMSFVAGFEAVSISTAVSLNTAAYWMNAFAGAAIGAGIGMIVGGMIAESLELSPGGSILMSIGGAMVGGALAYSFLADGLAGLALGPVGWAGVAIMVIASLFGGADCDPIEVTFECELWQPPVGGSDCEECNGDSLKPCSKYRCESLGATCELLNANSDGDELCVDGNPNDVVPPMITRPAGEPSGDSTYVRTDDGVRIVGANGGCLAANTEITFGIVTNEPSRCRFDVDPAKEFEDMVYDFGRDSYLYNHTTSFLLPDPSAGQSQGWNWSGELSLYTKCSDRNGLVSPGAYEISMCVLEGDDVIGPSISDSFDGDMLIGFDATSQYIEILTNEFSNCRWDLLDVNYSSMGNVLECGDSLGNPSRADGYLCSGEVPIGNTTTTYYVRCVDQPWLNSSEANEGRYSFTIRKPEAKISIDKIKPDSDYSVSTDLVTVDLRIATSDGGENHFCSYSFSGYDKMFSIFETGESRTHSVELNMAPGKQEIYVECQDETGDFDRGVTSFEIFRDSSSPAIARIWQSGGSIHFVTIEDSECKYSEESCRFAWDDGNSAGSGLDHSISVVRGGTYYIKCADDFGNMPSGCSVEVVAT